MAGFFFVVFSFSERKGSSSLTVPLSTPSQNKKNQLLRAGCKPDAGDYDNRTALHIASSENVLPAVKALVEAGADIGVADRWGSAPLDEAVRVGARAVIDYLLSVNAPTYKGEQRTSEFLNAASNGDCDTLRHMLQHGVECVVDVFFCFF